MNKITKCVILCAGNGTRLNPITKIINKTLVPIGTTPAIIYVIDEMIESGITDFLLVVGAKKNQIYEFFENVKTDDNFKKLQNVNISFVTQENLDGTGGAVKLAKEFANNQDFALAFADDITKSDYPATKQLIDVYYKYDKSVMGINTVPKTKAKNYGILNTLPISEKLYQIIDIEEKPKFPKSNFVNFGRYVLKYEIFKELQKVPITNKEIYLTTALSILASQKKVLGLVFDGKKFDIGTKENYIKTFKELTKRAVTKNETK